MQIAKSAALLGTAAGIVMLWGGAAAATGEPSDGDDGGSGGQINHCKSISINSSGHTSATCLNFEESFGKHKSGPQVNHCKAVSVSNVGNLVFFPMGDNSVHCKNIMR
ncbi:hypothetical protein amrb99_14790 [Actinomadura sp. RB99]|uniref:hypothetical protein n=1 Tax=Actinomadura sp. RB99 TaxID=2691577 RepID=UPI0016872DE6|nr:hypothetical protein [Actinomadura sp. RB99]MBD2892569.1 hypothetical protein [Actinomadura sp. RB99]